MKAVLQAAVLALLLFPSGVRATVQTPDVLTYEGEEIPLRTYPLESYFTDDNPRPEGIFKTRCTANWRGYVAHWKLEEGQLYLTRLMEDSCGPSEEIPLDRVFPGGKGPIKASWFTGTLTIPRGKVITSVGSRRIRERDLLIHIEKGKVATTEVKHYLTPEERRRLRELDKKKE